MEMVKSLGMALVYRSGLTCIYRYEGWQYHSLVDFQLSDKSDSIPFPDICAKSAERYTGFRSSGCNIIINVHCYGESASKIGEFINNLQFLSIQSDVWFAIRLSMCWLVYYLSLFCANCELKLSHAFDMRLTAPCIFRLIWHSLPGHLHRGAYLPHLSAP